MERIDGFELDLDRVTERLYQGGAPIPTFHYAPFSMIVFCAREWQPDLPSFRGQVVRAGFDDTRTPSLLDLKIAGSAAAVAARELERGGRVLVTCFKGWNRSGLVTGLVLGHLRPISDPVRMIRAARGERALGNEIYAKIVRAKPMRPREGFVTVRA